MQTHIDLLFGDGEYTFKLGLRQILAIEEKCGPIGEVFARLLKGRYVGNVDGSGIGLASEGAFRVDDIMETIRQGLIGGGAGSLMAFQS
ncbi:gene transfer agent family protein [Sphingomonas paeninsulae]|uniref:Gene transfer agent family protein n=1 Tax=Sphingomonas paeninsulae TaxID=2319844 RepID=A0A494TP86_SPHPE|nr:gene transfer agent family protein [Sphingomonas paeninsulae]AYJ87671.1 gene transfer agent family protein [Sphingomonas paeninsulae]